MVLSQNLLYLEGPTLQNHLGADPLERRKQTYYQLLKKTFKTKVHTLEQIIGELTAQESYAASRPRPLAKRVWASVEKEAIEVTADIFIVLNLLRNFVT